MREAYLNIPEQRRTLRHCPGCGDYCKLFPEEYCDVCQGRMAEEEHEMQWSDSIEYKGDQ